MRGQIKEVLSGLSKATVIVTHDQLEALTMADRIAIMRDGIIEQIGSPHEVFAKPANLFVASFIGTPQMNLIEVDFRGLDERPRRDRARRRRDPPRGRSRRRAGSTPSRTTIGIRPRALAAGRRERGADTFAATAELIEPMGAETLIHARGSAGQDMRVVVPRDRRVRIGEALHLRCDPRQTHIFDEAGRAVRA